MTWNKWNCAAALAVAGILLAQAPAGAGGIVEELEAIKASELSEITRANRFEEAVFASDPEAAAEAVPWLEAQLYGEDTEPWMRATAAAGLMWLGDTEDVVEHLHALLEDDMREHHEVALGAPTILVLATSEERFRPTEIPPYVLADRVAEHRDVLAELALELAALAIVGDEDGPLPDSERIPDSPVFQSLHLYDWLCVMPDFGSEALPASQRERNMRFRELVLALLPSEAPESEEDLPWMLDYAAVALIQVNPDGALRDYDEAMFMAREEMSEARGDPLAIWAYVENVLDLGVEWDS